MTGDRPTGINSPPNRRSGLEYCMGLRILILLVILFLTSVRLTVAAEKSGATEGSSSNLFRHQPLGFDHQTFDRIAAAFANSPFEVPQLVEFLRSQRRCSGFESKKPLRLCQISYRPRNKSGPLRSQN
jgi:hypothetical protein